MSRWIKKIVAVLLSLVLAAVVGGSFAFAESPGQGAPPAGARENMIVRAVEELVDEGVIAQSTAEKVVSYLEAKEEGMRADRGTPPGPGAGGPTALGDRDGELVSELVSQGIVSETIAEKILSRISGLKQNAPGAPGVQPAAPASSGTGIRVYINGVEKKFSPAPLIKNGSTLVPMRAFFEALGCQVGWDQATRTVTGSRGGTVVKLAIGNKTAHVNGQRKELAVEPELIDGSTFVPLRFVGEALGAMVDWDNGIITITTTGD